MGLCVQKKYAITATASTTGFLFAATRKAGVFGILLTLLWAVSTGNSFKKGRKRISDMTLDDIRREYDRLDALCWVDTSDVL